MKTAILYSALLPTTESSVVLGGGEQIFVRMEVVDCHYSDGLDHAKPRDGETFLNCVPLDEQKTA